MRHQHALTASLAAALALGLTAVACGDTEEENTGDDPIVLTDASTQDSDASHDLSDGDSDAALDIPDSGPVGPGDEVGAIEWCQLVSPHASELTIGQTLTAYAQVYAIGRTEGDAREDSGVKGQLGIGAIGSDPTADSAWTWIDATANPNFSDASGNHDEYMASHLAETTGSFAFAFRFQVDGGAWFYCDTDGHSASNQSEGFSTDALGSLTVAEAGTHKVGWCNLQNTARAISTLGKHLVTSQVYVEGLTENGNAGSPLIRAQIGHGAIGSDPATWSESDWSDAVVNSAANADALGNNNEYMATLSGLAAGSHAFAFRYKANGDSDWFYCDSDGHSAAPTGEADGFSTDKLGHLTVLDPSLLAVGWCRLQNDAAQITPADTFTAYGQVWVDGLTGASNGFVDDPAIEAQLGLVSPASDLRNFDADESVWTDAAINAQASAEALGNNNEYMASKANLAAGQYSFAFRFRVAGASSWTYCDLEPGSSDDFQVERQGTLTVTE